MWPFDLKGPEFLLFYGIVGALVITAIALLRHSGEPEGMPKVNLSDPYLIAYLRGGRSEVLRLAVACLVDRGVLVVSFLELAATEGAFGKATSKLEQTVVRHFNPSAAATSLFKITDADEEISRYGDELIRLGLMPDLEAARSRRSRMWAGITFLLGLAAIKFAVAIAKGHYNLAFLVLFAIAFSIAIILTSQVRLTRAGSNMIADLRTLLSGAKQAGPDGFAMTAAVFGAATIPSIKKLFPQAGASSSCGSDSGSSSSCGSSCGGGGCGGCSS